MTNKENALKVIRYIQENVEGLKELSEGCKFYSTDTGKSVITKAYEGGTYQWINSAGNLDSGFLYTSEHQKQQIKFEIIGHKVELNHLLLAVNKLDTRTRIKTIEETIVRLDIEAIQGEDIHHIFSNYDLTKTVEENLKSNPELTNYCLTLFGL